MAAVNLLALLAMQLVVWTRGKQHHGSDSVYTGALVRDMHAQIIKGVFSVSQVSCARAQIPLKECCHTTECGLNVGAQMHPSEHSHLYLEHTQQHVKAKSKHTNVVVMKESVLETV